MRSRDGWIQEGKGFCSVSLLVPETRSGGGGGGTCLDQGELAVNQASLCLWALPHPFSQAGQWSG